MKLSACVSTADIFTLRKIAQHYSFDCSLHSKNALLQEILFAFQSRHFLETQADLWMERWSAAYMRICLAERNLFSVEEIHALFRVIDEGETQLVEAMAEGWIYFTQQIYARAYYAVPEEFLPVMRSRLINRWSGHLTTSVDGPLTFREEGFALNRDVDLFLEYVMHHDVKLATGGSMYKRNLQQILALIEIEELPVESGWRFGYGRRFHDYPDRFALIYDFAYHMNLLEETDSGELCLTAAAIEWRQRDMMAKQRSMVKFFLSLYRRPITRLLEVTRIISLLATTWVESASMLAVLDSLVNPFYYDEVMDVWNKRILKMMMHLGLLRVGDDESGQTWFQITKLGQELLTSETITKSEEASEPKRILIVQPNFDIMVTADQPLVTFELAKFTAIKEAGAIRIYRLSEETVQQGLMNGHDFKEWIDFVRRCSQSALPGNVERTLGSWDSSLQRAPDSLTS